MSKIIGRPLYAPAPAGGGKPSAPKFTYDGDYVIRDDGVVELLTSGTITFLSPAVIDIFCVGGGGSGGSPSTSVTNYTKGLAGGGGGYTATLKSQNVSGSIEVVIGAGGTYSPFANGGTTSFGNLLTANGGISGRENSDPSFVTQVGRNGGSGGGGGRVNNQSLDGIGGSDGSDGLPAEGLSPYINKGGIGQGTTTREFGESSGKLYAGGGGGGTYFAGNTPIYNIGGAGGGGAGAWVGGRGQFATDGSANTGGGGGGGAAGNMLYALGGTGGTGICCFRDAQELPELAGTWVLNERLYAPERYFTENVQFTGVKTGTQGSVTFINVQFYYASGTKKSLLRFAVSSSNIAKIYDFTENTWNDRFQTITFPAGATASNEFRAWLASNATKQTA